MPESRLLEHWGDFYLLTGTAAAALIALLFVAASIAAGMVRYADPGVRKYMTPVVMHFSGVLMLSAIALVPSMQSHSLALVLGCIAAAGLVYCGSILVYALRDRTLILEDRLFYAVLPALGYCFLAAAAVLFWREFDFAPNLLAAAVLTIMAAEIRNAWDLMLFWAQKHKDPAD